MPEYRVELDAYSGPLDLLLYLVRRDEIDLADVPIGRLTQQYLEYLRHLQAVDVDVAGEFLVMAATLLEIKSQMLVPRPESTEDEPSTSSAAAEALDPRYELVQQLLAYKRFKDAAAALDHRREDWSQRFPLLPARTRPAPKPAADPAQPLDEEAMAEDAAPTDVDLDDISLMDLAEAFARILETIGKGPAMHEVVYDDTPIGLHAEDIVDRLGREPSLTLRRVFEGRSRSEAIGLFLAMLELIRQRKVKATQKDDAGDLQLELRPPDETPEPAGDARERWTNPLTGMIEYDWPSEHDRKRAERRARLRATYAAKGQFAKAALDDEALDALDADESASDPDPAPGSPEVASSPDSDAADPPAAEPRNEPPTP